MFQRDKFATSAGELTVTFVGHGTLMFQLDGKVIHVDPVRREADYSDMPKADVILVTHGHGDHLDPEAIETLTTERTEVVVSAGCTGKVPAATVAENGTELTVHGLNVEAVAAYNIQHMRSEGVPFHPRGEGNGYIITFGDVRVYVAADTEDTPEVKALQEIDVAFLPMNLPYTMSPQMVADAAKAIRPKVLYPYHYGQTDPQELVDLLADEEDIEVRIRELR